MRIYVQAVQGCIYELEVNEHTSIEEARDLLIKSYYSDFKNNLPTTSPNSKINIKYNFVYNGKYLFDPDPFSTLKEDTRVILYIKKSKSRGQVRLEIIGSESEIEEEDDERNEDQNNHEVIEFLRPIVNRAANISLFARVFNPLNSFWDHQSELARVENILQGESSQAAHFISSSFMEEHFRQLFRYNDINIGTVLNMIGGGPLLTFGNSVNNSVTDNENNNNDNNNNNNNNDNNNNTENNNLNNDRDLYNNRIYYDYSNSSNTVSELDILIMEMPTTAKTAYNELLRIIQSTPELDALSKRIGALRIAEIFKEKEYDINKSIDFIKSIDQVSK